MKSDNYILLNEVLQELRQDLSEIESEIEYNKRCIKESEIYINKFNEYLLKTRESLIGRISNIEKILQRENNSIAFLNIQEEDRKRIARDLHDTSLQNLAHLVHKIELSSMYIDTDPIQAKLELTIINKKLRETIDEIRNVIFDLRPMTFDDFGLKYALERLLINLNEDNHYEIVSDIDDVSCENNVILVSIYRLAQESLNNIKKHADAEKIIFSCKNVDKQCILDVEDNGKGFEETHTEGEKHFGIFLMRERVEILNGTIIFSAKPGKGTKIHIEIPLEN